jgi:hypothetical protein
VHARLICFAACHLAPSDQRKDVLPAMVRAIEAVAPPADAVGDKRPVSHVSSIIVIIGSEAGRMWPRIEWGVRSMGRRWLVGLVAVGVVAVSAGCGSDNSGGSSAATSAAATSAAATSAASGAATTGAATTAAGGSSSSAGGRAATGTPVKIGFICSCTGALSSSVAIARPAYESWVKAQNAKGGLNGHPIDLIVKDDAENPGTSVSMVHELVEQDNVIALVEISNADTAWADYVTSKNIPSSA